MTKTSPRREALYFDVWGCRGSRNLDAGRSKIGNHTSCYSVLQGDHLIIFDAGRGLLALSAALSSNKRFRDVRSVYVLITHAHLDHWEGLRDAEWFWAEHQFVTTLCGPAEALDAIRRVYDYPTFVPLEWLTPRLSPQIAYRTLASGQAQELGPFRLLPFPLHHYSGSIEKAQALDTLGYRLSTDDGPTLAYLSDHEPTAATAAVEMSMSEDANLVIYDSHFPRIADQRFGHGSVEHTANMARKRPDAMVFASHHGPTYSDKDLRASHRAFGKGLPNFHLAVEGSTYRWHPRAGEFQKHE